MEIKFGDSFAESIKTLVRHNTWWYKTYDTIRYDIPRFIKNVWIFRKSLWNTYWWDHHGPLTHLQIALDRMADCIETHGNEVDESRQKKVASMRRAAQLIKNYNEDLYTEMAEAELGELVLHGIEFEPAADHPDCYQLVDLDTPEEKEHNRKVFDRSREIGEAEWAELWEILKGQDYKKFENSSEASWDSHFDGSGIRGWWD